MALEIDGTYENRHRVFVKASKIQYLKCGPGSSAPASISESEAASAFTINDSNRFNRLVKPLLLGRGGDERDGGR